VSDLPKRMLVTLVLAASLMLAVEASPEGWGPLIARLEADGHRRADLESLFASVGSFDPEPMRSKMTSLFETKFQVGRIRQIQESLLELGFDPGSVDGLEGPRTRQAILRFQKKYGFSASGKVSADTVEQLQKILHPDRVPPEPSELRVYSSILQPERLSEAREFHAQNQGLLERVETRYGIPPDVVVGVLTVETRVGKFLGSKKALSTLASMAVCGGLGCVEPFFEQETLTHERREWLDARSRRVADWAYAEVKALLEYAEANGMNPVEAPGSIYGAIGISQFMPTSAIHYGVDGNGDGVVNLFDLEDAVFSMANYLREHGWKGKIHSRNTQRRALYRYNRSQTYVNTVLAVADYLKEEASSAPASSPGR